MSDNQTESKTPFLDKFKIGNMYVVNHQMFALDDVQSMIHKGIMGFCGCGTPAYNLLYVLDSLEVLNKRFEDENGNDIPYEEYQKTALAHFGSYNAEVFFCHWADVVGLTLHGGGIGGSWLSDDGKDLLGLLREWKTYFHDKPKVEVIKTDKPNTYIVKGV